LYRGVNCDTGSIDRGVDVKLNQRLVNDCTGG